MPVAANALSRLECLRSALDSRIAGVVGTVGPAPMRDALEYVVAGGKRVRPVLTLLGCAAAGGDELNALNAGVAIELLHAASLVHDDIMDASVLRRGRTALHVREGSSAAILTGDLLTALAFRTIAGDPRTNSPAILGEFTRTFVALCEGQSEDIAPSSDARPDPSAHAVMVRKKTAELLGAAMAIGAMVETTDERIVGPLRRFGLALGMAYQAKDDLLDVTATDEQLGKSAGTDARNGRSTYLTVAYPQVDAREAIGAVVRRYTDSALNALGQLPRTPAVEALEGIAGMLCDRSN